jgi:hypothetical protein
MAESLLFDDELITMEQAGDEGMTVDDPQGEFSLTLPPGWYVTPTDDDELRLVVSDAEVGTVGALAVETGISSDDETLQMLTEAMAGALDEDAAAELVEGILGAIDLEAGGGVEIDPALTEIFSSEESDAIGTIRIGANADIDGEFTMPLTMYLGVYGDKVAALIAFSGVESLAGQEETILGLLNSLTFAE